MVPPAITGDEGMMYEIHICPAFYDPGSMYLRFSRTGSWLLLSPDATPTSLGKAGEG